MNGSGCLGGTCGVGVGGVPLGCGTYDTIRLGSLGFSVFLLR